MSPGVCVLPAGSRGCEHIPSSSGASPFLNPLNQCHREFTSWRAAWFPKHLGTEPSEGEALRAPLPRSSPQRGSQEGDSRDRPVGQPAWSLVTQKRAIFFSKF